MTPERGFHISERWFSLLLRLYPADFRNEMGESLVETYVDRARETRTRGASFVTVWFAALRDSLLNGVGERIRPAVSWKRGGDWGRDLQSVGRRFRRSPLFFVSTIATLTIGLGAFAVVYTAVDKILIEPLPYQDPDDLYMVWRAVADINSTGVAGAEVVGLQNAGGVIEDAAGLRIGPLTLRVSVETDALRVTGMGSSPNLFGLLGVEPALGRGFQPDDIAPDAPMVVVLTDGLWKRFGGNDAIIGTEIRILTTPVTVIGVMPPGFQFSGSWTSQKPDLYYPLRINPAERPFDDNFLALIRARRGAPREEIDHAVDAVGRFVAERDGSDSGRTLHPVELKADLISDIRPALIALGFAGVFLVLVLAVNLASLLLARAAEREREFAVSRALGASGLAVARATLAEGGLLGLLGGVAGAVAGAWGTRLLVALAPLDLPRLEAVALESDVAVVVIAGGVLLGLVAAAVPATWSLRVGLASLVAASAVRGGGSSPRARRGLIVNQVALSLVLLSTGGLVVRSFERLLAADPGFEPHDVLTFAVSLGDWLFPEHADSYGFQDRVDAALVALPGGHRRQRHHQPAAFGPSELPSDRVSGHPRKHGRFRTGPSADQPYLHACRIRPGDRNATAGRPGVRPDSSTRRARGADR